MRKRTYRARVWLNENEVRYLRHEVEKSGLTQETFLRKLIMGKEIKPRVPQDYHDLLHEVRAIGNNINQAVKIANTEKAISCHTTTELLVMQRQLLSLVKELI